ncbi:MAG: hypothetical protein HC784_11665, partial [Hydrococcus sp. CSU_1_8]|nr:hypothetical protein [Hydrococcus sp. CSU_1_8]
EPTDLEIPIITIEFKPKVHPRDEYCYDQPQFVFTDVVVLCSQLDYCQINQLDINSELDHYRIVGMKLVEPRSKSGRLTDAPYWLYEIECLTRRRENRVVSEEELIAHAEISSTESRYEL